MTSRTAAVLADFRRQGSCPVDWVAEMGMPADADRARTILDLEWVRAVDRWSVDGSEASLLEQVQLFDAPFVQNDEELVRATENLRLRRKCAFETYLATFGRFSRITFISPSQHNSGKHFRPGKQLAEIVSTTTDGGPALFLQDYSYSDLQSAFWMWFDTAFGLNTEASFSKPDWENFSKTGAADFWQSFRTANSIRFALQSMAIIGASDGEPTDCVCFDISFGAGTVHVFPVTKRKAEATNPAGFPLLGIEFGPQ